MKMEEVVVSCKEKISKIGNYKYALLVLMIGIGLMLYPFGKKAETIQSDSNGDAISIEEKLEDILSRADGVGAVKVLLSLSEGPRYTYQTDERTVTDDQEMDRELETVLVRSENGGESPVITHTRYPIYEGAVVVCEGADNAAVRLRVVNAVSDLTGLGSDRISVIKMKGN